MNLYVIPDKEGLTTSYHSDGSCVIVAADVAAAERVYEEYRERVERAHAGIEKVLPLTDHDWNKAMVFVLSGAYKEQIMVFPNAGCC